MVCNYVEGPKSVCGHITQKSGFASYKLTVNDTNQNMAKTPREAICK